MGTEEATPNRRWRPRFSLLTLLLGVVFVGACGGLWWRWEPWVAEATVRSPGSDITEVGLVPQSSTFYIRQLGFADANNSSQAQSSIHLFDVHTRKQLFALPLSRALEVSKLPGFSPNGRYMVSHDGVQLVLYDLVDGRRVALEKSSGQDQQFFGFADDGRLFAYLTDGACGERELWTRDMETGHEWRGFRRPVFSFRTVANRPWAFCVCKRGSDTEYTACDLRTGDVLPPGLLADFAVGQTDCDEQATMLAFCGWHANDVYEVGVWRPEEKAPRFHALADSRLTPYFHLSPDGRWMTVQIGPPAASAVLNPLTGESLGRLPDGWNISRFLPDDRALLYHLVEHTPSGLLYQQEVWDLKRQVAMAQLEGTFRDIESTLVSKDGRRLISLSRLAVWDLNSGRLLFNLDGTAWVVQCSPDGSRLVVDGGSQKALSILDAETGSVLHVLEAKTQRLSKAAFFPDGHRLLVGLGQEVRIWSRRRPEYWWGIAWLPEFWIALISGGALTVIAARNLSRRKATKAVAA